MTVDNTAFLLAGCQTAETSFPSPPANSKQEAPFLTHPASPLHFLMIVPVEEGDPGWESPTAAV